MLKKFILKVLRSMGFLGGFILGCRMVFCLSHRFIRPFNSKITNFTYYIELSVILVGALGCLPFVCETTGRMIEYNVFTIPRVLEGCWDLLVKTGKVSPWNHGEKIVFTLSTATLLIIHKYFSDLLPSNYRKVLDFIFGKSTYKTSKYLKEEDREIKEVEDFNEEEENEKVK